MTRRTAAWILGAIVAYTVFCSWIGIDFGYHWDERYNVTRTAAWAVENRTILPNWYYFPSMLHDIALVSAIPDAIALWASGEPDVRTAVAARIDGEPFLIRLRLLTSFISALASAWVFLAVYLLRNSLWEAIAAAAIVAGSWELHYHSRWLTADPLVAQFGALTMLLAVAGHVRRSPRLLRMAGIVAGLACATKYPGGALLVPVFIACGFAPSPLRRATEVAGLFAAAFVVVTPGAVVHPLMLLEHLGEQLRIYGSAWGAYTVSGPLEHARLLLTYVGIVQLSHFPPIALFLSLAAVAGAVRLARNDAPAAAIILAFPVLYFGYFAFQRVMIVRNVLVLIPFVAVPAAIGLGELVNAIRSHPLRVAAVGGIALMIAMNLGWLFVAARSISMKNERDHVADTADYIADNADEKMALSRGVSGVLQKYGYPAGPRLSPLDPAVDTVIYVSSEIPAELHQANRWNYARTWLGPYEVNFNYYPTWAGRDRIVVSDPERMPAFRNRANDKG